MSVPEPNPDATAVPGPPRPGPAPGSEPLAEGQCREDSDCGPDRYCQLNFNGAEFLDEPGICTDEQPVYEGRPLMVAGGAKIARLEPEGDWGREGDAVDAPAWADFFRRAAAEEHASIAAFARTICQLMALGAPAELLESTQGALADEIAHARACSTWARRLGRAAEPGALREAIAPLADGSRALLDDVLEGGCIGETLAAHRMAERALAAPTPGMAASLRAIAEDEARHAALAFRTARWLVEREPQLATRVEAHRRRFEARATSSQRAQLAALWPSLEV